MLPDVAVSSVHFGPSWVALPAPTRRSHGTSSRSSSYSSQRGKLLGKGDLPNMTGIVENDDDNDNDDDDDDDDDETCMAYVSPK